MFHLYFYIVLMFKFFVCVFSYHYSTDPPRPAQSAREAETQLYLCGRLEYSDAADYNPCILNARSIRNKLEHIYTIAEEYHILCSSETHLDKSIDSSSLILEGFGLPVRKDRSQHDGSVMIYISDLLVYERRTDLEDPRLEAIWVEITLKSHSVLICCSYRSDFNVSQALYISSVQASFEISDNILRDQK